jgi:transcriptional regulator with XRE-family HTH domain
MPKARKPRTPSQVIAAQLPRWRDFRNVSAQGLADRIELLGGGLGRVAITRIETGKRGISLDEALLLAAALNVPPPVLLFPLETGEHVAVTPTSVIHPDLATRWLAGEGPLALTDRRAMRFGEWAEARWTKAAQPLRLYDAHREAQRRVHDADLAVRRAEVAKDRRGATDARYRFLDRLRALDDVRRSMRDEGITPPKLAEAWVDELRRLGRG